MYCVSVLDDRESRRPVVWGSSVGTRRLLAAERPTGFNRSEACTVK